MAVQAEIDVSRIVPIHEVAWEAAGPGLLAKPLWSDHETQRRAYLGRIEAGRKLPLHRHLGDELVYVVEGDVTDESGTITAGQASYRPPGCVHSLSTERGTTVLIVVTGGTELASSRDGQPRSLPIDISKLDWVDSGPDFRHKEIWEDHAAQRSMRLVRFEPGATIPLHRHLGDMLVFGIEGESTDESGSTLPGYISYWPNQYVHSVQARNGATVIHYGWGNTETVNNS